MSHPKKFLFGLVNPLRLSAAATSEVCDAVVPVASTAFA